MSRGRKGLETRLDMSQLLVCCFFYYIFFLTTHNSIYRIYELYTRRPPPQRIQPLPNRAWTQARAGNRLETRQDVSQSLVCLFLLYHFSTSANPGPSMGTCYSLQQCYIDTVMTHSTHSIHRHVYLLYNPSIVL